MQKLKRFALRYPIAFGFLLILLFSLLSTLTWPITQLSPYPDGYELGVTAAKLMISACFMLLIVGFGWTKTAGYTSLGHRWVWLLTILLMLYNVLCGIYAFTDGFQIKLPTIKLGLAILVYTFATSLIEETMYRGLLLTAMVKAWNSTRRGLFSAAILSSLFWASLHFVNLLIRPFPIVAWQVLAITMVGFVYSAIALSSRSIWPVIIFHWAVNGSIGLQVSQIPNFEETTAGWAVFAMTVLPMVIVGSYLIQKTAFKTRGDQAKTLYDKRALPQ